MGETRKPGSGSGVRDGKCLTHQAQPSRAPRRCDRRVQAQSQKAVRKTLHGLPIHELGSGRFTVPVLRPGEAGLPFSMSLDLYRGFSDVPRSEMSSRPQQGIFSLQYILDGSGQLVENHGQRDEVQPGDSILAPHGHTYIQVRSSEDAQRPEEASEWQMASLTLLLPKELLGPTSGKESHVDQMTQGWDAASSRQLSKEEAARIVAGARETAQAATHKQRSPSQASTGSSESTSGDFSLLAQKHRLTSRADLRNHPREVTAAGSESDTAKEHGRSEIAIQSRAHSRRDTQEISDENSQAQVASALEIALEDSANSETSGGSPLATDKAALGRNGNVSADEEEHRQGALDSIRAFLKRLARWRQSTAAGSSEVLKRSLSELSAFRLPHQTNRLALVFDPLGDHVNFTFGVEIFEPGHKTTPHVHNQAHELFFILAGEGEGFCDGERFPVAAGEVVVFPPGTTHGIDVDETGKMYCLEIMQPNDMFAELVRAGMPAGGLLDDDLCILIASGCA